MEFEDSIPGLSGLTERQRVLVVALANLHAAYPQLYVDRNEFGRITIQVRPNGSAIVSQELKLGLLTPDDGVPSPTVAIHTLNHPDTRDESYTYLEIATDPDTGLATARVQEGYGVMHVQPANALGIALNGLRIFSAFKRVEQFATMEPPLLWASDGIISDAEYEELTGYRDIHFGMTRELREMGVLPMSTHPLRSEMFRVMQSILGDDPEAIRIIHERDEDSAIDNPD